MTKQFLFLCYDSSDRHYALFTTVLIRRYVMSPQVKCYKEFVTMSSFSIIIHTLALGITHMTYEPLKHLHTIKMHLLPLNLKQ